MVTIALLCKWQSIGSKLVLLDHFWKLALIQAVKGTLQLVGKDHIECQSSFKSDLKML